MSSLSSCQHLDFRQNYKTTDFCGFKVPAHCQLVTDALENKHRRLLIWVLILFLIMAATALFAAAWLILETWSGALPNPSESNSVGLREWICRGMLLWLNVPRPQGSPHT